MKGISQVTSIALLVAVAVSVAGIYAEWAPSFAENVTENAVGQTNNDIRCGNAALSIKEPTYDKTGEVIFFDLVNSGTIRFTSNISVAAFNDSSIVNRTTVKGLEVEEKNYQEISSSKIVDKIIATSDDCPDVKDEETLINVRK